MADVTFNIYGGNNQILPNATKAEQNFYGDQFAEKTLAKDGAPLPLTEEEQALSIYINKVESLRGYITLLRSCKTARDLGEVVATMRQQEPSLTDDLIVKQNFISLLLPFVPKWEKGQTIDNIRVAINNAWTARKKNYPSSRSLKHPQKSILRYMGKYPKILRQVS